MRDSIDSNDDLLDRATASLRGVPVPDGPPALVQQRTLQAIAAEQRPGIRWNVAAATAAAILIVTGVVVATLAHFRHVAQQNLADARALSDRSEKTQGSPEHPSKPRTPTAEQGHPVAPPPPESTTPPSTLASHIAITGHVYYRGPRPARKVIDLSACPQCAQVTHGPIYDESLVVNDDGSLQNVVVSISGGLPPGARFASASDPVTLDQKGCTFRPHVIVARVGQPIIVKNSDPFLHTVRSLDAEQSPAFNLAQPTIGQRQVEALRAVETFAVTCDLHPWMKAWVRVFNHPYFAVTGTDGSFSLPPLPPGTYRVKAWHETLGVREKEVVVTGAAAGPAAGAGAGAGADAGAGAGHPVSIDFVF
jgi:hypothetical protein